jgi:competence protein ComEC
MKRAAGVAGFCYLAALFAGSMADARSGIVCSALCGILAAVMFLLRRKALFVLMPCVFAAGFLSYGLYLYGREAALKTYDGSVIPVSGIVTDKRAPAHDLTTYQLKCVLNGTALQIVAYTADTDADIGDELSFDAVLTLPKNTAAFEEQSYWMSKGVLLKATALADTVAVSKAGNGGLTAIPQQIARQLSRFAEETAQKIYSFMPNDTGALLGAVILGDRSAFSDELYSNMKRAGLAHYASVSGFHMTLLAHLLMMILGVTPLAGKRRLKFALLCFLLLSFSAICGFTVSVLRSLVMIVIFYSAQLFGRRVDTFNSLGFAALVLLLPAPYACLDAGLLMSFAGTLGVGIAAPAVDNYLGKALKLPGIIRKILSPLSGTICANLCTLPISVIYFGGVSLISPVTNLIASLPFMFLLICGLLYAVSFGLFTPLLVPAGFVSEWLCDVIDMFGGWRYAFLPANADITEPLMLTGGLLVCLAWIYYRKAKPTAKTALATLCIICAALGANTLRTLSQTQIAVFSDGRAGFAAVSAGDTQIIVSTDSAARVLQNAGDYLADRFEDQADLFCLLSDSFNAQTSAESFPADRYFPPETEKTEHFSDPDGRITLTYSNGAALLTIDGVRIFIGSWQAAKIASQSENPINIMILSGYVRSDYHLTADYFVYLDRRQLADYSAQNSRNAYFDETRMIFVTVKKENEA